MALDLGNPIDQQTRDDAHGRAYQSADEMAMSDTPERRRVADLLVIDAMEEFGGEFIRKLGAAARAADDGNLRIIKEAFGFHWKRYSAEGVRRRTTKRTA